MSSPLKALMLVYTEPGANIDESEFNHWYDNEHVPLRSNIPEVFTGRIARIKSTDGSKPAFAATYDLESAEALQSPAYTNLTVTRSEREKNIFAKIGNVYPGPSFAPSPRFDEKKGASSTVLVETKIPESAAEEEYNKWYDEGAHPDAIPHSRLAAQSALRSRGRGCFWHRHGLAQATETPEHNAAMGTEWMAKIEKTVIAKSKREFGLRRVW